MIFIRSALTSAKVREIMNELDRCDPLHHLEPELISQRSRSGGSRSRTPAIYGTFNNPLLAAAFDAREIVGFIFEASDIKFIIRRLPTFAALGYRALYPEERAAV